MALILNYASPEAADRTSSKLVTAAIVCGGSALFGGLIVMALWLISASPVFAIVGTLWIGFGTVLAISGGVCLVTHWVRRRGVESWLPLPRRERKAVWLLLLGFPAAVACIAGAFWLAERAHRYDWSRLPLP